MLINADANVRVQSDSGTALQAISLHGCVECARKILNKYGHWPVYESKGEFGTSLHAAAFQGHAELVKLLCGKLNVNAIDKKYGNAMTAAVAGFNQTRSPEDFSKIYTELVRHKVRLSDIGGEWGGPVCAAAYHGQTTVVKWLLRDGAKVKKAKGPSWNCIQYL